MGVLVSAVEKIRITSAELDATTQQALLVKYGHGPGKYCLVSYEICSIEMFHRPYQPLEFWFELVNDGQWVWAQRHISDDAKLHATPVAQDGYAHTHRARLRHPKK